MKKLQLTSGANVLVDESDYESLSKVSWWHCTSPTGNRYAIISTWVYSPQPNLPRPPMPKQQDSTLEHSPAPTIKVLDKLTEN